MIKQRKRKTKIEVILESILSVGIDNNKEFCVDISPKLTL